MNLPQGIKVIVIYSDQLYLCISTQGANVNRLERAAVILLRLNPTHCFDLPHLGVNLCPEGTISVIP